MIGEASGRLWVYDGRQAAYYPAFCYDYMKNTAGNPAEKGEGRARKKGIFQRKEKEMKYKKIVSKILACAMVVTTVFTGNVTTADAAGKLEPVAKYDFETEDNYKDIQLITEELENFEGEPVLKDGRGGGQAISTEDTGYGLKLPQLSLGTDYTVSVRVWSDWGTLNAKGDGTYNNNFVAMSLGTAENRISLKVPKKTNGRQLYLFSGDSRLPGETMGTTDPKGAYWAKTWRMLTITQYGDTVTAYLEGEKKAQTTVEGSLLAENGSIMFGVEQSGSGFAYLKYDDISVYDVALNDTEVMELFNTGDVTDNRSPDKILAANGITVSPTDGVLLKERTMKVEAVLPAGVPADTEGLAISYASNNTSVATVDASTGVVTGVAKGEAKITAKAELGTGSDKVTKTAEMTVKVMATPEEILQGTDSINVSKNITCAVGGTGQVEVNLPTGLTKEDVTISYAVSPDDGVATVDANGKVTAAQAGKAQVVTSVKAGQTIKTGITEVWVKSAADFLNEKGITVTPSLKITETGTAQIEVTLPEEIKKSDVTISYALKAGAATGIATVNNTGLVTGVAAGRTVVTTTVTCGAVTKTADTNVRILSTEADAAVAVEYDLSAADDGKLTDISNHNNDAVIQGTNYSFATEGGEDVMTLGANTYLELPKSIVATLASTEKFTIETKFAKSASCGKNAWLFCFGANTNKNYLFVSPNFGDTSSSEANVIRSGIMNSTEEKLFNTSKQPGNDVFHTLHMVFDEGTVTLYMDGVQIKGDSGAYSIDSGYSMQTDIIDANTTDTVLGYIGKSLYTADGLFQGKLSSFKIYNSALTAEQIQGNDVKQAFQETVNGMELTADNLGSKNPSVDEIKYDLASLPGTFQENPVTWSSNPEGMIAADGKVYNDEDADKDVKLTATVTSGSMTATKEFAVKVLKADRTALNATIATAQGKIAEVENYTADSIEKLKAALKEAQSPDIKGQTRIDSADTKLKKEIGKLVAAKGDRNPFEKITDNCWDKEITLEPTKTATVFRLPSNLKLNEDVIISYESSHPNIASVNENGLVTAGKRVGYARITTKVKAVYDGFEMEYQTLVKVNLDVTKTAISTDKTKLAKGKTAKITVTPTAIMKELGSTVTYTATGAVSVNASTGVVTAKKSGSGKVTVKVACAGKQYVKRFTYKVGEISGKSSVKRKKSITLKVKGLSGKVKWSLDKKGKKLAKITSKGKLTAKKKKGTVTVTAKADGVTITKKIKIK